MPYVSSYIKKKHPLCSIQNGIVKRHNTALQNYSDSYVHKNNNGRLITLIAKDTITITIPKVKAALTYCSRTDEQKQPDHIPIEPEIQFRNDTERTIQNNHQFINAQMHKHTYNPTDETTTENTKTKNNHKIIIQKPYEYEQTNNTNMQNRHSQSILSAINYLNPISTILRISNNIWNNNRPT